jgi:hypothetical protein
LGIFDVRDAGFAGHARALSQAGEAQIDCQDARIGEVVGA